MTKDEEIEVQRRRIKVAQENLKYADGGAFYQAKDRIKAMEKRLSELLGGV